MDPLAQILSNHGPMRASRLAELVQEQVGGSAEAARKRLSRAREPIRSFPFSLLPKQEKFFYMENDRTTERFWTSFLDALRDTDSVYGAAIDGLLARGGVVAVDEFPVISGAPNKKPRHVPVSLVLSRLRDAGFLRQLKWADEQLDEVVQIDRRELGIADTAGLRTRNLVEGVMLDGLREWARKNGLASYNSIVIRGEARERLVGPYMWDLTGPSYLLPLREGGESPIGQGFLVADAFAGTLVQDQVRYFVKKAHGLRATPKIGRTLPVLFAQGFTGAALTYGHKAGILMATPETLFGSHVARSLKHLVETLSNAAAIVSGNPGRLTNLLENLTEIEGAAGNLRGVLFELIVAFLVRYEGSSIDMGKKAYDRETGRSADIDVLMVKGSSLAVAYECKGKSPGGRVTLEEVEDWLRRIPIFKHYVQSQPSLQQASMRFELWTSGDFEPDALGKLKYEKTRRTTNPIDWKDGAQVRAYSSNNRDAAVTKAINEHFFRHPLAEAALAQDRPLALSLAGATPAASAIHPKRS